MENNGIKAALVLFLIVAGVIVFFLQRGISDGQPLAYSIAFLLWTAISFTAGAAFVLVIQAIGENREAKRTRMEQERFQQNTQENLALMGAMVKVQNDQARVQNTQNAMLLRQARDATRMLPPGNGDGEAVGFPFDEADFMDLED